MNYEFDILVNEAYEQLDKKSDIKLVLPKIECETSVTRLHWKNVIDYLKLLKDIILFLVCYSKKRFINKEINLKIKIIINKI
jgi:hypothetical protein